MGKYINFKILLVWQLFFSTQLIAEKKCYISLELFSKIIEFTRDKSFQPLGPLQYLEESIKKTLLDEINQMLRFMTVNQREKILNQLNSSLEDKFMLPSTRAFYGPNVGFGFKKEDEILYYPIVHELRHAIDYIRIPLFLRRDIIPLAGIRSLEKNARSAEYVYFSNIIALEKQKGDLYRLILNQPIQSKSISSSEVDTLVDLMNRVDEAAAKKLAELLKNDNDSLKIELFYNFLLSLKSDKEQFMSLDKFISFLSQNHSRSQDLISLFLARNLSRAKYSKVIAKTFANHKRENEEFIRKFVLWLGSGIFASGGAAIHGFIKSKSNDNSHNNDSSLPTRNHKE